MWVVDFYSKTEPNTWREYKLITFETEEEANVFMVQEIFKDPSYDYRVRKLGE